MFRRMTKSSSAWSRLELIMTTQDETIEPHVARIVRNAAIAKTSRASDALITYFDSTSAPKPPSRSKKVPFYARKLYKAFKAHNVAIFHYIDVRDRVKQSFALVGEWIAGDGKLHAFVGEISLSGEEPLKDFLLIYVSRHALERVSERLHTLDTAIIRDEFASAVAAIAFEWLDSRSGSYYARTPHGIAIVAITRERLEVCITTWISEGMAKPGQLNLSWMPYKSGPHKKGKVTIETVNNRPVMRLIKIREK
jgi:hypothetical protein